jgi:hypothetical protein
MMKWRVFHEHIVYNSTRLNISKEVKVFGIPIKLAAGHLF